MPSRYLVGTREKRWEALLERMTRRIDRCRQTRTELLEVFEAFVHFSPQLSPFGKLVLCAGLEKLLLGGQYLFLEGFLLEES